MNTEPTLFGGVKGWHIIVITLVFVFGSGLVLSFFFEYSNFAVPAIALFVMDVIFMVLLYYWIKSERINFKKLFGPLNTSFKEFLGILGLIITLFVFDIVLVNVIEYFFPGYSQNMDNILTYFGEGWWLAFLGVTIVVFAPLYEEVLVRGILMQHFTKRWNPTIGILISAVFFTLLHSEPKSFPQIFLLAIIFSVMFFKKKKLGVAIVAHSLNNFVSFVGFMIVVRVYGFEYFENPEVLVVDKTILFSSLFWLAISGAILGNYLWKNWPRKDALIPYEVNVE